MSEVIMSLKFENVAEEGQRVRAWDFEPDATGRRPDRYVEGTVLVKAENCYIVKVEVDTDAPAGVRQTVRVPMEVFPRDFDERVSLID